MKIRCLYSFFKKFIERLKEFRISKHVPIVFISFSKMGEADLFVSLRTLGVPPMRELFDLRTLTSKITVEL